MSEDLKIWLLGILSFGPLLTALGACVLPLGEELSSFVLMGGLFGLRLIVGIIFTGQVWRNEQMDLTSKVFWTLGLLVFLSILVIPYYWYKFWWEPHRMEKMFNV